MRDSSLLHFLQSGFRLKPGLSQAQKSSAGMVSTGGCSRCLLSWFSSFVGEASGGDLYRCVLHPRWALLTAGQQCDLPHGWAKNLARMAGWGTKAPVPCILYHSNSFLIGNGSVNKTRLSDLSSPPFMRRRFYVWQ